MLNYIKHTKRFKKNLIFGNIINKFVSITNNFYKILKTNKMKKIMFSAVAFVAFSFASMANNSITDKKNNDIIIHDNFSNEEIIILNDALSIKDKSLSECYAEGIYMYNLFAYGSNPNQVDPIEMAAWAFEVCMCNCLPEEGTY